MRWQLKENMLNSCDRCVPEVKMSAYFQTTNFCWPFGVWLLVWGVKWSKHNDSQLLVFLLSTYFSTYFRCEIWYSACYVTSHCWVSGGLGWAVLCPVAVNDSPPITNITTVLGWSSRWLFSIQRLFAALCKYLVNTQQESGLAALWRLQCREAARRHNSVVSTSVLELLVTTIRALYTV